MRRLGRRYWKVTLAYKFQVLMCHLWETLNDAPFAGTHHWQLRHQYTCSSRLGLVARRKLADAAAGLVTYACPHFGSWLADVGWNLRYVGAAPAAVVSHLKPGPHLEASMTAKATNANPPFCFGICKC